MTKIGYARVSTTDQDYEGQVKRLKAEGCTTIRKEKVSAASREGRDELAAILDFLRPDDELVVTRLDRLGRSTRDVLNIVHECDQRGAFLTVLEPHVSTKGAANRIVITVLGMVAEMERGFIKARQREGIAKAKAEGTYKGGKKRIDDAKVAAMREEGRGPTEIAKAMGISRMQVHRILKAAKAAA
jgi:DNA invertase Pin-like site-specific DNA recombinase